MQSVFLRAAAAHCSCLVGEREAGIALKNCFCCLRVVGDAASLKNIPVGGFKT